MQKPSYVTDSYKDGPIVACSTNMSNNAAIGIIRLSGFNELNDLQHFFSQSLKKIVPRKVYLTHLINKKFIIDSVLITYFKAPQSYNGENILEISAHGGVLNLEKIVNIFMEDQLFRLGKPGEFTYRALKNRKLSLNQVEGLDLILNSQSHFALEEGQSILKGKLSRTYEKLHQSYIELRISIELSTDFLEDIGEERAHSNFLASLRKFKEILENLLKRTQGNYNLEFSSINFLKFP